MPNPVIDRGREYATRARDFLARPEVAKWLPRRKVVAGGITAVLVLAGRKLGLDAVLPAGYAETAAFAIAAYFVPDPQDPEPVFEPDPALLAALQDSRDDSPEGSPPDHTGLI